MKYKKIEFIAALVIFALYLEIAIEFGFSSSGYNPGAGLSGFSFFLNHYLPNLLLVLAPYAAFLALNYYVVPKYWLQKKFVLGFWLTAMVWAVMGLIFMVAQSYLRDWVYRTEPTGFQANLNLFSRGFFQANFAMLIYALYVCLREVTVYLHGQWEVKQPLRARIIREGFLLLISIPVAVQLVKLVFVALIARFFGPMSGRFFFEWLLFISLPYCIIIYLVNLYWLIPLYKRSRNWKVYGLLLTSVAGVIGAFAFALLLQTRVLNLQQNFIFHWLLPTFIATGVSWWVYQANQDLYNQLTSLRTALGTSDANLQYLRSQINPHFLFNALNTLYGTALIEKADKTGEGIQKLGDMMRFMLHENNQDKIALSRELDYVRNYIDLQNMRLALSPDLVIEIVIADISDGSEIAPMLLIPFVENAYKHGISLQEKSWIKVNLYLRDKTLHLEVHNSKHPVNVNDPERDQSGTGLDNVRQRLQLIYPDRHQLVMGEDALEFFVLLTINLAN